ncbi:MAG: WYL domain-containing protein [Propionibacteriales bacterium]|nr:WYL domain-containing protein [Propionibacteriales bacterium]
MTPSLGGKQRLPMERLVRLVAVLHQYGTQGVPANNLVDIAGFDGVDAVSQLAREFRYLRELGWQIDNIGGEGTMGIYRMSTVDNRLAVKLSPEQQAALLRAVLLASRDDLVERLGLAQGERPAEVVAAVPVAGDAALSVVTEALRSGCLLRFRYAGSARAVHPEAVRAQNGKWYLRGHEEGSDIVKMFVVSRMSDVVPDPTVKAVRLETERRTGLHPMTWQVDPPIDVRLCASVDYASDVRRWLGTPTEETESVGDVTFTYRVTNRSALRARIYELGPRVRVLGPEEIRDEILDELAVMAGE